jgi:Flagellar biosynthesis protein, FliO
MLEMLQSYMTYILYALGVLAVLIVLLLVFRMFQGRTRGRKGMRLGIVEYCEVDQSRRLVLLRRDGVEHLVLIGGNQDLVVESGIGDSYVQQATQAPEPATSVEDVVPYRAPRAPVFGARRPVLRSVDHGDGNEPA